MEKRVFVGMTVVFFVLLAWIVVRKQTFTVSMPPSGETFVAAPAELPLSPNAKFDTENKNTPTTSLQEKTGIKEIDHSGSSPNKRTLPPLIKIVPNQMTLREEVRKNPEETPKSLLLFSLDLGERMEEAGSSTSSTDKFFGELEECVLEKSKDNAGDSSNQPAQTAQALCLLNANRLAQTHEELKGRYKDLELHAAPAIVSLTHSML